MKPPPKKTAISLQKDNQLFSVETFQCEISQYFMFLHLLLIFCSLPDGSSVCTSQDGNAISFSFFFLSRTECNYECYIMLERVIAETNPQLITLVVSPDYKDHRVIEYLRH